MSKPSNWRIFFLSFKNCTQIFNLELDQRGLCMPIMLDSTQWFSWGLSMMILGELDQQAQAWRSRSTPPITQIELSSSKATIYGGVQPISKGMIGEVRCSFLRIYAPTLYNVVFLLHALAPASIKIGFGTVRFGLVRCSVGVVLRFGLDSFGSN